LLASGVGGKCGVRCSHHHNLDYSDKKAGSQSFEHHPPLAAACKGSHGPGIGALKAWPSLDDIETFSKTKLEVAAAGEAARRSFTAKLAIFFKNLHRYAPAFDVFVQQQPFIATIIWGSCRLLVQVRCWERAMSSYSLVLCSRLRTARGS
jgi:hypothetical protein